MRAFMAFICALVLAYPDAANASTQSEVRFPGNDAGIQNPLAGTLLTPDGAGPFPAVVLLHGCAGVSKRDMRWASRLTTWGFAVLHLDSLSPRGLKSICADPSQLSASARASDAQAALAYLSSLPSIRRDRIGVVGWSHGAWTALSIVHEDHAQPLPAAFQAVVAFYPYCPDVVRNTRTPLLILIGERDTWTPSARCRDMRLDGGERALKPLIQFYENATHAFDDEAPQRVVAGHTLSHDKAATEDAEERVKAFFDKHLR